MSNSFAKVNSTVILSPNSMLPSTEFMSIWTLLLMSLQESASLKSGTHSDGQQRFVSLTFKVSTPQVLQSEQTLPLTSEQVKSSIGPTTTFQVLADWSCASLAIASIR